MQHFGSQQLHAGVADALARLKNAAERLDRETINASGTSGKEERRPTQTG